MKSFAGILIFALGLVILGDGICYAYSLAEAQALERQQNWNGLLKYAQGWTQAQPNEMNAWASLSVAYYFLGHPDLALEPTKRAIALNPREPVGWTALGWVYRGLKRYPEATDAFKHAVDLAPQNGNFWNNLAAAYADEGNYAMTLQSLERQGQSAGPYQNDKLWYNLGNGLSTVAASTRVGASSGKPSDQVLQEAIYAYNQALRMNPRYAEAYNNRGVAEEALGQTQNALNDYQRAGKLGNAFGHKNYNALQNAIAAAKRQAAVRGSTYRPDCSWCVAKERAIERWNSDYYLRTYTPRPQ